MTISSSANRNTYTGNGAVSVYSYTFKVFDQTNLLVTVKDTSNVETTLALTTDYTVSGVGETSGGSVTLVDSGQAWLDGDGDLLTDYVITIRRVRPLTQLTDIRNQGDFFPEVHEDEFDKQIMIDQQQQDEIDRTIKLPETLTSSDFSTDLPTTIGTADASLVVNATGDGFAVGPTTGTIASAEANAVAAAASASAASTSETNAASSAAQAASSLASAFFTDAIFYTNSDSPVTLSSSDAGKLHVFDSSGGSITVTLPEISTLTLPYNLAFLCSVAGNDITFNRTGTDTIQGATSKVLSVANTGFQVIADDDPSPDTYSVLEFGSVGDGTVTRVKLADGAVANATVSNKTTTYTATVNDDVITVDSSSSAFTITLPAISGIEGKILEIKKTNSDFNAVTIDGDGAETIDGATTKSIISQYEKIRLIAGPSEWHVLERYIPSAVTTYTPVLSWTTNVLSNTAYYSRHGKHLKVTGFLTLNGAPNSAALDVTLPTSLSLATSIIPKGALFNVVCGTVRSEDDSAGNVFEGVVSYITGSTTELRMRSYIDGGSFENHANVQQNSPFTFASSDEVFYEYTVPIAEFDD